MLARRALLLIPLLAAGCATAGRTAASPGDADAPDVRFARVSSRSVTVQVREPVHAAFVYVGGRGTEVAWLADETGIQSLPAGSHAVALEHRPLRTAGTACNPGRRTSIRVTPQPLYGEPLGRLHLVQPTGCTRPTGPDTAGRRLLVLVSPEPLDPMALEDLLADFNQRHGGISRDAGTLSSDLASLISEWLPGVEGYHTALPAS